MAERQVSSRLLADVRWGFALAHVGTAFATAARESRYTSLAFLSDVQGRSPVGRRNPHLTEWWGNLLFRRGSGSPMHAAPDAYTLGYTAGLVAHLLLHPLRTTRGISYLRRRFSSEVDRALAERLVPYKGEPRV